MASELEKIRPEEAWLPYEGKPGESFGRKHVAHLYRRAGFSANSQTLDQTAKLGPQEAARHLLMAGDENPQFAQQMHKFALTVLATNKPEPLTAWWLHRMLHTPAPLLEKTTLFWHGHFATSAAKVTDTQLMFNQNEMLRKHALGKFEEMVRGIARDPAMLLYLDSATNRKTHPNENFAREVMELFCLGLGNYTEKDIQELARTFTGWEIQHGQFKFNQFQHDYGRKTILGKSGDFDGDEGISVLLDQPATARFIATKLIRYFITDEADIPPPLLETLAQKFRDSNLTTGPVLEMLFSSRLFYSDLCIARKLRSPVELGIGMLRALDGASNLTQMATELRELGQLPFFPPNVKGWNAGVTWINSSSLLGRSNLVRKVLENGSTKFGGGSLADYVDKQGLKGSGETVDWLCELLLAVPVPADVRAQLISTLETPKVGRELAVKQTLHLLLSLPEFQLT
ncbi:MAG: DUF1800 domain-containing protein [Planctomycetaceae bacterium]